MAETLKLKVVTPEGAVVDEDVAGVTARSDLGEFSVLPQHRLILAALEPGRLIVERPDGGSSTTYAVDKGFLEGGPDHANVITQRCVDPEDIDAEAVAAEVEELQQQLDQMEITDPKRDGVADSLAWARAQLSVVAN
jgi:F-type H+-transporting ATPase subunit epsilon